jgi:transcriptional regulator with XRE-family HTH domain|tara:strand:- start:212 stop:421 length:210 start_codon:yes stop_codon:yes gene_type:complete
MKEISERFSRNMRIFRDGKGYSQGKLAGLTDLHCTYISQIERGRSRNFSLRNAERIAIALDVTLNDLTK